MEDALIAEINDLPWCTDLRRRTQHYGYRYDYRSRGLAGDALAGPMPTLVLEAAHRIAQAGWMDLPQQCIVNEYLPGQGISDHIDRLADFGPTVVSLSLGSSCTMNLKPRTAHTQPQCQIYLPERSLLVLEGESRTTWTHGIHGRKSDILGGSRVDRGRRVSLTFRTLRQVR